MGISNTTQNAILALTFQAVAWGNYADNAATAPQTTVAVALHTADPGAAGTQTTSEATYTSYARQTPARTTGGFGISGSSPTTIAPVAAITFPAGTGGSGTVSYFSSGKNSGGATAILWSGTVTPNIVTGTGITPQLSTASAITLI
jgi:hypothetical protein